MHNEITLELEGTEAMYTINELPSIGFGNPDSAISYDKQMQKSELSREMIDYGRELIKSGECIVPIAEKDDGCIDGRRAVEVLFLNAQGEFETKLIQSSILHERAKVAGGGYLTASIMSIAINGPSGDITTDLRNTTTKLTEEGIACGVHTGDHGHGDATDCGANDKIALIMANQIAYQKEIANQTSGLLAIAGVKYDPKIYTDSTEGISRAVAAEGYTKNSTGATRFDTIQAGLKNAQEALGTDEKPVGVSKHLADDHNEAFITAIFAEDVTFSQALFAQKMIEKFPDVDPRDIPQVFVVNVGRIVELARAMSHGHIDEFGNNDEAEAFQKALYAGVAYQVATAATLTDGTLPMFAVTQ